MLSELPTTGGMQADLEGQGQNWRVEQRPTAQCTLGAGCRSLLFMGLGVNPGLLSCGATFPAPAFI